MKEAADFLKPRNIGLVLLVAILYFLGAKLGLSLAFTNASVSPVWPPTGIAIALVLWFRYRALPGVLIGALIANYVLTDVSFLTAAGISIGNSLEALVAVYLVQRFVRRRNPFNRAIDVLKFVAFAVILSTAIAATIGNLVLSLSGNEAWSSFGRLWFTWWLGDAVGALVVTPLILSWLEPAENWRGLRLIEAVLLLFFLSLMAATIYTDLVLPANTTRLWGHLAIPLLLWAAFRFGTRGVSTAMASLSAIAIWGTIHGSGPFAGAPSNEGLIYLQAYVADFTVTTLALAAIVTERRQAQRNLAGGLSVTRILAESPALSDALPRIMQRICNTFDWTLGAMWRLNTGNDRLECLKVWPSQSEHSKFEQICYQMQFEKGVGLPGRVWKRLKPASIADVTKDDNFPRAEYAAAEDLHAAFAFPIVSGDKLLGVMEFFSPEIRELDGVVLSTFSGIGSQIGQFIERKQAEEAMELASLLPEENPYPVFRLLMGRIFSYVNPAGRELLGDWKLDLGDDAPPEIVEVAEKTLSDGRRRDVEVAIGEETYMVNLAPVMAANYVNLYFSNITARKSTEEALLQNQEWLRLTMAGSRIGTWTRELDETNRVIWSPELEQIFGLQPGEFPQTEEAFFEFINPEDRERLRAAIARAIETRKDFDVEFRIRRKDGAERWMLGRGRSFYDEEGRPYRLAGLGLDITGRKRAEMASKRLAAIVEFSDDAIIGKDLNGVVTSWNLGAERLYGYTAEEMIGKPIATLIPAERPDEEPAILARLRRGEVIDHYETIRVTKEGKVLDVSLTVSPIIDADGKVIGASKIARDITQKKRAEKEREELLASEHAARSEAEAANRIKDEFLATLSHELRTPLTAMLGWLTMMRSGRLDDETSKRARETVERNARAQAQLIEDLVDVSRIAGGKMQLDVQPVDLSSVINAAVDIVRPAANARGVSIEIAAEPVVGPVAGDPARLQQIVWNLLSNAVKFTSRDGYVYVKLRRVESFAEVEVRDTGIGIDADFLPWVFERFRQAESSVTRSHRGLGLGLAIVRHLIELHGGTVSAHSDGEGKGSTFTIQVPLAEDQALVATASGIADSQAANQTLTGMRVLLVEDEPDARELLSLTLRVSGAKVQAVETAREALSNIRSFKPHVLLSDIGLPVESGYDLIRQVRALRTKFKKIPAVALTAFATERDRKRALAAGFQVHLSKPVEPQALIDTIEKLVNGRGGGR
ncbi:MAG TPA: MASE1 domain-containing protein [Pyrinomonadaceae bacterium]|nr:MASE1 domain-containing protein [Pyrinomonadaceae bacterium]